MIKDYTDLYNLTENPKINELSLVLLLEYYEHYLHSHIFYYDIKNSEENPSTEDEIDQIELRFDKDNFCHLLAIEKIKRKVVHRDRLKDYRGLQGWENVKNRKITIEELKKKETKGVFKSNKDKFVFFYLLPKLVENPKAVLYNKDKVDGSTNIDCEILFHDQYKNVMVHLGIEKNQEKGYYIPRTFFVERITKSKNGLKFVGNQQSINVTKTEKVLIDS